MSTSIDDQLLIEKIKRLPPEKAAEVVDFIDFITQRDKDGTLARAVTRISEVAFTTVWDNPDDAEYDRL